MSTPKHNEQECHECRSRLGVKQRYVKIHAQEKHDHHGIVENKFCDYRCADLDGFDWNADRIK